MKISDRITQLRKSKGLSQEELAEQLGVSSQVVSDWESGISSPDTVNAVSLSRILGVTADFLLTGESNNPELSTGGVVYNKEKIYESAEPATAPEGTTQPVYDEKDEEKKPNWKAIVSIVVAICLLVGIGAIALAGKDKNPLDALVEEDVPYTYVLVHGMGGWGEKHL